MDRLPDLNKGLIIGFCLGIIFYGLLTILSNRYGNERTNGSRELIEYADKQMGIETLRSDYLNRDSSDLLEIPGVRRAADDAAAGFDKKRDEVLQRLRYGNFD